MIDLLNKIASADCAEINELITALLDRYSSLFPDWEIVFLSFPKGNTTEKNKHINDTIDFLKGLLD